MHTTHIEYTIIFVAYNPPSNLDNVYGVLHFSCARRPRHDGQLPRLDVPPSHFNLLNIPQSCVCACVCMSTVPGLLAYSTVADGAIWCGIRRRVFAILNLKEIPTWLCDFCVCVCVRRLCQILFHSHSFSSSRGKNGVCIKCAGISWAWASTVSFLLMSRSWVPRQAVYLNKRIVECSRMRTMDQ